MDLVAQGTHNNRRRFIARMMYVIYVMITTLIVFYTAHTGIVFLCNRVYARHVAAECGLDRIQGFFPVSPESHWNELHSPLLESALPHYRFFSTSRARHDPNVGGTFHVTWLLDVKTGHAREVIDDLVSAPYLIQALAGSRFQIKSDRDAERFRRILFELVLGRRFTWYCPPVHRRVGHMWLICGDVRLLTDDEGYLLPESPK